MQTPVRRTPPLCGDRARRDKEPPNQGPSQSDIFPYTLLLSCVDDAASFAFRDSVALGIAPNPRCLCSGFKCNLFAKYLGGCLCNSLVYSTLSKLDTEWLKTINSRQQTPCLVAAYLQGACEPDGGTPGPICQRNVAKGII